jgi:hypothetical protein
MEQESPPANPEREVGGQSDFWLSSPGLRGRGSRCSIGGMRRPLSGPGRRSFAPFEWDGFESALFELPPAGFGPS